MEHVTLVAITDTIILAPHRLSEVSSTRLSLDTLHWDL